MYPRSDYAIAAIALLSEKAPEVFGDHVRRARLDEHVRDAGVADTIRFLEITRVACDRENRDGARVWRLPKRATEFEAVQSGYGQIGEHGVGGRRLRLLQRLVPVVRFDGTEPSLAQGIAVKHPRSDVVLDDEYQRLL